MYPTMTRRRELLALVAVLALFLSLMATIRPATALAEAGDNGHPTGGEFSDLKGGIATFTFQAKATLTCATGNVSTFAMHLDYAVTGTLPAGATIVVYLSPNNGAVIGNAGGDAAGYVAQVESNFTIVDVGGLTDTGTLDFGLTVTHPFAAATGGILGVVATESDASIVTNSKTNSLNCTEAPSPTPTATPVVTPTPTATPVVTPTPTATPVVTPTPTPEGTPDTEMSKTASVSEIDAGGSYDYTLTIVNDGSALATGVTVTDNLDNDLVVNSVTPSKGTCDAVAVGNLITCHLGDLVVDEVATVVVNVTAPAAACPSVDNRASVTADNEFNDDGSLEVSHSQVVIVDVICETQTATPTPTPEGSEAGSTATPTPTPTPEGSQAGSTGTPAPSATPEGSVAAATGTPAGGNLPNTASGTPLTTPLVAFGFGLLLLGSIGTLAYANVAANRRRR